MSISNKIKSLFSKNNVILLILSLIIAIVFWGLIITYADPDTTYVVKDVPVQINTSSQEATSLSIVSGNIDFVDVTVSVPRSEVPSLDVSNFNAEIDLTNETVSGTYPKRIEVTTDVGFVKILSVSPSDVTISLDVTDTKSFTVEVDEGDFNAPEGYYLATTSLSNDDLSITGPKTLLNQISAAKIKISIKEGTTGVVAYKDCPIILVDSDGNELPKDHLILSYNTVTASVPILRTKTVPLNIDFINKPKLNDAFYDVSYYVDNKKINEIDIAVTDDKYDEVNEIIVGKIDFSTINKQKFEYEIKLEMPSGVTNASGIDSITILIQFKNLSSSSISFDTENIAIRNKPKDKEAVIKSRSVRVTICGDGQSVKSSLVSAKAFVDLVGTESGGAKEYPLIVDFGDLENVWVYVADNLTPPTVNVEVK